MLEDGEDNFLLGLGPVEKDGLGEGSTPFSTI